MENELSDLFGQSIYTYTDAQAVEDGVLVAIAGQGNVNRVTRAVFDHFVKPPSSPAAEEDLTPLMNAIQDLLALPTKDGWRTGTHEGKDLWLIPNEVGGLTLMFPDDY